jgi:energy-coupling factor transport system permease protein
MNLPHPFTALALAFLAALVVLLAERPLTLLLLAIAAAAYALAGASRGARWWRWLAALLLAGTWSMALTQGLFYGGAPRTVWLELLPPRAFPLGDPPGLYLYREGLAYGVIQSLRFHAIVLLGAGLLARYSAERLAAGLRTAGLPGALCFLSAMALRQVPVLAEEMRTLWLAQRLRGMRPIAGVTALPRAVLLPLLAANLRRADEVAAAFHSRGISVETAALPRERPPARERLAVWLGAALAGFLGAAVLLTRLHVAGAFSIPFLEPLYAWVVAYV